MKKKNDLTIMAKYVLMTIVAMLCLTGCKDDKDDDPEGTQAQTEITPEGFVAPSHDLLTVTVTDDMPTAVFSQFDETSMGAALLRRLPIRTAGIEPDTKLVLMKGSHVLDLTDDDWDMLARFYVGGGYIALEKPSNGELLGFYLRLMVSAIEAAEANLTADGDVEIYAETPEAARQQRASVDERLKARYNNMKALTRGDMDDPGWIDEVYGEMVIMNPDCSYVCEAYGTTAEQSVTDSETNEEIMVETSSAPQPYSSYASGLMADGAAIWLNGRDEALKQRQAEARRLATRAAATDCINEMMSASDEFTNQYSILAVGRNYNSRKKQNALHETITVWGVHSTTRKKDYYYVKQKVTIAVGGQQSGSARFNPNITLYFGPYSSDMWCTTDFVRGGVSYGYAYGSWLKSYTSRLNLTGAGSVTVEKSMPSTDNNNTSETIAIGESHSETNTIGFSIGGSFGSNGASFNPSFNFSHGWTDGTSFTMSNTSFAKELKCVKNTNGSEVTWKYENGANMSVYKNNNKNWCHRMAPDAVTNDVDIENQICWSVSNPSSNYELSVFDEPCMRTQYMATKGSGSMDSDCWIDYNKKFTLKTPNRSVQEWYMDITYPEIGQEGHHGDKGKLIEYLQRQFPDIYQTRLSLADQTETSENTIKYLVDYSKSVLQNSDGAQTMRDYALDLGLSQYTIKWYTIDKKHKTYELTIKAK